MTRKEKLALVIAAGVLAFVFNRAFLDWVSLPKILEMNDVLSILPGYRKVPDLLLDSGRWWTGSWIQEGIIAYRPLASYLYWIESDIGLRRGFVWVGWMGVLLLTLNALLAGVLAWRLTRSRACVWLAVMLGVALRFYNWNATTPDYWLAWYPVHQELLMNAWLLGAIICFDAWNETAEARFLFGAWACFVIGCLTKEHVYIFPILALVVMQFRRKDARLSWRDGMMQVLLMLGFVFALWAYRAAILTDPRNPQLKPIHFIRKPWLYGCFPLYPFVLTGQFWFPGLAIWLFVLGGVLVRWKQSASGALLSRPFVSLAVGLGFFGLVALYCVLTLSITEVFWYLFDGLRGLQNLSQLLTLIGVFYVFYLLVKYRKQEPTAAAFALMMLAYAPVISYLGWHYTVAAWFVRCAYWALVAKLVWLDLAPLVLPRLARLTFLRFGRFDFEPLLQKR